MARSSIRHLYSHAKYGDADYEMMEDCDWYIETPENKRILIKFISFELEYEQNCSYDYVQIFDGGYDDAASLLGKYCGNTVKTHRRLRIISFSCCLQSHDINCTFFFLIFGNSSDSNELDIFKFIVIGAISFGWHRSQ